MAGNKKIQYDIGVDPSQGISGVKSFSRAVLDELRKADSAFDETATSGEKVATALSAVARVLDDELGRAAQAADALAQALGPELAAKADVSQIVGDLQRMGLTFEDIVADADKLAGALKEMDAVQVKGLDSGLGGVKTSVGDIGKSADSSRSALANMIGNTTQDLGALGGIAGSAGVAIGQMGEYAADAALGGEKLGSALKSMALVAGPIAALTLATQTFATILGGIKAEEVFKAELVDDFTEAIKEGTDEVEVLKKRIEETGELAFETGALGGGGFLGLGSSARDLIPTLNDLGISFEDWQKLLKDTSAVDRYRQKGLELASTNVEQANQYLSTADALETYQDSIGIAGLKQDELNQFMGETVTTLEGTSRAASIAATQRQNDARLAIAAGREQAGLAAKQAAIDEARPGQIEAAAAAQEDLKTKTQETAAAWDEIEAKVDQFKTSAQEVELALDEALTPLEDGTAAADAFRTSLDKVGRAKGLDTLERFGDTSEAIQGVFKAIKENKGVVPDIFETGKQSARDFRDMLEQAATAVGDDLSQVLEESGGNFQKVRQRARELRSEMREGFAVKLGIDLEDATPEERKKVEALVNAVIPTGKEVELGIKLSKRDLLQLKADLAIEQLQQLVPATALQLKVDMAEGEITPQVAAATAQEILNDNGVEVDLDVNTTAADDKLVAFALEERNTTLGVTVSGLPDAAEQIRLGPGGTGWPAIEVPVKPVVVAGGYSYITGGGAGTLTAPTGRGAAPPAAVVAGAGMTPIPIPVAGPAKVEYHVHQSFNAAVIGSPFDVMREVDAANRRAARLLPKYP